MDVFDLVAKISLDSSSYEQGLSRAKSSAASFGNIFKANIASDLVMKGFNGLVSGAKAAGSGLKSLVESATSSFGNYQQMVGGVQKLYGNMGMSLDTAEQGTFIGLNFLVLELRSLCIFVIAVVHTLVVLVEQPLAEWLVSKVGDNYLCVTKLYLPCLNSVFDQSFCYYRNGFIAYNVCTHFIVLSPRQADRAALFC